VKNYTRPFLSRSTLGLSLIFPAACLGWFATAARAQAHELDVGVRSTVVDKPLATPFGKSDLQEAREHGKIYGIVSVKPLPADHKLVKPVNESAILQELSYELNTHGYHLVAEGQRPEIVLTVLYGRGWLTNPYRSGSGREMSAGGASIGASNDGNTTGGGNLMADAPTVSMTGIPTQGMKEMGNGFEAKSQKAQYEKLCIRVTAWQYPADAKTKVKQLWNTTMIVDDPDNRDLNEVAAKMLEAGAPYFDKEIKEEEVDVYKPLPDGHVKVGTPEVVEPKAK
jgi:hypothetical protein